MILYYCNYIIFIIIITNYCSQYLREFNESFERFEKIDKRGAFPDLFKRKAEGTRFRRVLKSFNNRTSESKRSSVSEIRQSRFRDPLLEKEKKTTDVSQLNGEIWLDKTRGQEREWPAIRCEFRSLFGGLGLLIDANSSRMREKVAEIDVEGLQELLFFESLASPDYPHRL